MGKMLRMSLLSLIILSLILPATLEVSDINQDSTQFIPSSAVSYSNIIVNSDSDFTSENWLGLGTPESPYRLKPKLFTDCRISISNTRKHFRLSDLMIETNRGDVSIELENVENGQICNSSIRPYLLSHLYRSLNIDEFCGLMVTDCKNVNISDNQFFECGRGVWIRNSQQVRVTSNQIRQNINGIDIDISANCTVSSNRLANNTGIAIYVSKDSRNSTITLNKIGFNTGSNAQDNDNSSIWIANSWDDYSGSGNYSIPGTGNNFDVSPFKITSDIVSPDIIHSSPYSEGPFTTYSISAHPGPIVPQFNAVVSDETGIDCVFLCITSGINRIDWYKMSKVSSGDEYFYAFSEEFYNFWQTYYIWTNDTEGNVYVSHLWLFIYEGYTTSQ